MQMQMYIKAVMDLDSNLKFYDERKNIISSEEKEEDWQVQLGTALMMEIGCWMLPCKSEDWSILKELF